MQKKVLAIAFFLSTLLPLSARAQNANGLTIFGDSLSDNGNDFRVTGGAFPPSPPYFQGRFSNGPVWVETLGNNVKFTTTSANFAFGGAQSGTVNQENLRFPPGALPTPLPGLQTEIDTALQASPRLSPDKLYVVWAGANDYLNPPPGTVPNPVTTVSNLSSAVTKLSAAGARNIIVVNLPDLGKIPGVSANPAQSVALTQLSATHNNALRASLQILAQNNSKLNIIPLDANAVFSEVRANPARFGFKNITEQCLGNPACTNPNEFFYWDAVHPTTAGHRILSEFALAVLTGSEAIAPQGDIALNVARRQTRDINGRLLTLRTGTENRIKQTGVFVNGDINFGAQDTTATKTGFDYTTKGVTVGTDFPITQNFALGVAFSYGANNTDLKNNRGNVDVDSYSATLYSLYSQKNFYVDALFSYGWTDFDFTRKIAFDNRTATATTNGNQLSARLSTGYNFTSKGFSIGPTAGIRYERVNIDGYTESGAGSLNMLVRAQDAHSLIMNVGAYASYAFRTSFGSITPYFGANYEHEFANDNRQIATELVTQPGIPMRRFTGEPDRDFVRLSAGVLAQFSKTVSGAIGYETVLGRNNVTDNYINAQIRFQF